MQLRACGDLGEATRRIQSIMGRGTIHKGGVEGPAGIYGECGATFFNGTALPHHKFGTQFESKYLYKALAIGKIIIAENFRAREKTFALWNKRRIWRKNFRGLLRSNYYV